MLIYLFYLLFSYWSRVQDGLAFIFTDGRSGLVYYLFHILDTFHTIDTIYFMIQYIRKAIDYKIMLNTRHISSIYSEMSITC